MTEIKAIGIKDLDNTQLRGLFFTLRTFHSDMWTELNKSGIPAGELQKQQHIASTLFLLSVSDLETGQNRGVAIECFLNLIMQHGREKVLDAVDVEVPDIQDLLEVFVAAQNEGKAIIN